MKDGTMNYEYRIYCNHRQLGYNKVYSPYMLVPEFYLGWEGARFKTENEAYEAIWRSRDEAKNLGLQHLDMRVAKILVKEDV